MIERVPILQRTPIVSDNNLLLQDSMESAESFSELLSEVDSFELTEKDKTLMLEDAFMRRFASLWALKYKTIKGKPTTFTSRTNPFKHRPWQQMILDDDHHNIVVEKSRQLGLSEVGMTAALHFLIMHDETKGMYIFPRNQQMVDFSKTRIAPVFKDSEYFQALVDKSLNSVSTKKIGNSYLFMRSGWGEALGEGADVDSLNMDEYDRLKDGVELAFQEGLKSSKYGLMRRWSTPTIPGRGINKQYQKSDQRRYIWTCEHCGEKQFLTLEDNVIQINPKGVNNNTQEIEDGTFIIGCKKCKRELNRWGVGEWVAQYPTIKETRGYHISQLDACWITADDIMRRRFNYTSKQLFYNYVIGDPYASEGLQITDEDLRASIRMPKEVMARNSNYIGIVAGIDWGEPSYMALLGVKSNGAVDLLNLYTAANDSKTPLRDVSQFCSILRAYNPNLIICDSGYGSDKNAYGYTQFPASWYACSWTTVKDARSKVRFLDQWNENSHEVTVDKTKAIQRVLHSFKNHLIGLFPWNEKIETLCTHLKNTRIMDMEDEGLVYQYATRVGADHFVSAIAYASVGVDKLTGMNTKFNNKLDYEFI